MGSMSARETTRQHPSFPWSESNLVARAEWKLVISRAFINDQRKPTVETFKSDPEQLHLSEVEDLSIRAVLFLIAGYSVLELGLKRELV